MSNSTISTRPPLPSPAAGQRSASTNPVQSSSANHAAKTPEVRLRGRTNTGFTTRAKFEDEALIKDLAERGISPESILAPEKALSDHGDSLPPVPAWKEWSADLASQAWNWAGKALSSVTPGLPGAAAAEVSQAGRTCSMDGQCPDSRTASDIRKQLKNVFNIEKSPSMKWSDTLEDALIVVGERDHSQIDRQCKAAQLLFQPGDHLLVESPEEHPPEDWCYGIGAEQHGSGGCFGMDTAPERLAMQKAGVKYENALRRAMKAIDRLAPPGQQMGDHIIDAAVQPDLEYWINGFRDAALSGVFSKRQVDQVMPLMSQAHKANGEYVDLMMQTIPEREAHMRSNIYQHAQPGHKTIVVKGATHVHNMKDEFLKSGKKVLVLTEK